MRHFSPRELREHLDAHQPFLLDVREPWEFAICHLDHSELMPMRQIPQRIHTLEKEQETVVICHHGVRSRIAGHYLEQAGFTNIINLAGGIDAWAKQVDPGMTTY